MSLAGDILRAAIERSHEANQRQQERVDSVCNEFQQHIGKPWKFRIANIAEAVKAAVTGVQDGES
jgi:nickel-dependent lactate racemase